MESGKIRIRVKRNVEWSQKETKRRMQEAHTVSLLGNATTQLYETLNI